MTARRSTWLLLAAIGLTLAIGIGAWITADRTSQDGNTPPAKPNAGQSYVAIGDSFTAGGPIGRLQPGSATCQRSIHNYPTIVARERGFNLTDASCGGATTSHVLAGRAGVAPQIDSVTKGTDFVTVSVGGNDLRMFADVFVTCFRTSRPTSSGAPCRAQTSKSFAAKAPEVTRRVGAVLDEVRRRAPDAHIVAINYLRLMPTDTTCAETPFAQLDVAWLAEVERAMSDTITDAATTRGIDVVDMYSQSAGHDLCGTEPWVNGAHPKPKDGILFHPNGAGERAIALGVIDYLRERDEK